jgi:hypothetical protein
VAANSVSQRISSSASSFSSSVASLTKLPLPLPSAHALSSCGSSCSGCRVGDEGIPSDFLSLSYCCRLSTQPLSRALLADTERKSASLDHLALQWLLEDLDEDSMDKFVTGLAAPIYSPFVTDVTTTMDSLVDRCDFACRGASDDWHVVTRALANLEYYTCHRMC